MLIAIDKYSDYIPGASSLTNLCCIFQKGLFFLTSKENFIENSYTHVYHKNLARCLIAYMPILGNIALAIYYDQKIVEGKEIPKDILVKNLIRKIKKLHKSYKPWLERIDQFPENRLPEGGG